MDLFQEIETALGLKVVDITPLSGGCVGQVYRVDLADGERIVAKVDQTLQPKLSIEAYMLFYLAKHSRLPVPSVLKSSESLLLMEFLPGKSQFGHKAQEHAAELLADLHNSTNQFFGLDQDTLIGGLHQPNPWRSSWLDFFREHRLLYINDEGNRKGQLPDAVARRVRKFCDQLDKYLMEPERPSLIHGDVWTTNILAVGDRITGFVDPAIYYAHNEIELAFATLFGTFGDSFFRRYDETNPIAPGFFEERRDIYNLYPLLVHVNLFGGSYVHSVVGILNRFGF